MSNVIPFNGETTLDIPVDGVLDSAKEELNYDEPMLVVGCSGDDDLYFASSSGDKADLLLLLERAKQVLLDY